MDAVLSVQGASAPVKKKSFFSKFTRLNMLRLARAVIPAAVLMMFFPQLAMAAQGQDLMASGNTTVKATFGTRVLSDNESKVFFEKVKGQYPEMDIKIPFLTVMETLQYKPAESAAKVQCPVLIVIAGQDSVNPPEQGKALYDAVASGTKELYEEADACHYDIYEGAFFERVAAVQTQWFKKHL